MNDHDHLEEERQDRDLIISIGANFLITAGEAAGGILSGSLSLLSDALHNLSDAFSLIITLIALKLSRKENTESRTFGYKRAEILAALLNSALLVIVSFYLFREAIIRLAHPAPINSVMMIAVAAVAFLANTASAFLLKGHSHDNLNIRASYLHLVSDALSSLGVIIGGVLLYYFNWIWVDPLLTIVIGVYVLIEGFRILNKTVSILMQNVPEGIDIREIQKTIEGIATIRNIHHVHLWQVSDRDIHFEAHVNLKEDLPMSQSSNIKQEIDRLLKERFGIGHSIVQFEYQGCDEESLIKTK